MITHRIRFYISFTCTLLMIACLAMNMAVENWGMAGFTGFFSAWNGIIMMYSFLMWSKEENKEDE